jgi:hypothetical protein
VRRTWRCPPPSASSRASSSPSKRCKATRFHDGRVLAAEDVFSGEHLRVTSRHGIDIMRGGLPPFDSGRPQDKLDLSELEAIHGELTACPATICFALTELKDL